MRGKWTTSIKDRGQMKYQADQIAKAIRPTVSDVQANQARMNTATREHESWWKRLLRTLKNSA